MYAKVLIILISAFMVATGIASVSYAGSALDSDVQSKLSRFKARQKLLQSQISSDEHRLRLERRYPTGFGQPGGETPCGAIDLGNVKNLTGIRRPREVTVIIDGDVINSNNHCR